MIRLVPDLLDSDTQYNRYYHRDLDDRQTEDLLDELHAIQSRLWFVRSERYAAMIGRFEQGRRLGWLRERTSKIQTELAKRRYSREGRSQPKPKLAEGVRL
jgi:hypothetical protein